MTPTRRHTLRRALAIQWAAAPLASALGVVLAIASGSIAAAAAYLTRTLLDELALGTSADADRAIGAAIAATAVTSLAAVTWYASSYLDSSIRNRVTAFVERRLFATVIGLSQLAYFENPEFHAKLVLATNAARTAPQQLTALAQTLLRAVVAVGSLAGVVMIVWPAMALLLAALGAVGMTAQLARVRHDVRFMKEMVHGQRWHAAYRQLLLDPRAAKEIRLYGASEMLRDRMIARLEQNSGAELGRERSAALTQIGLAVLAAAVSVAGAVVVTRGVLAGRLGLGDVALFTAAVGGIQGAFAGVVSRLGAAGEALALFRGYLEIIDTPALPPPRHAAVAPLRHGIELRDVWFRYTSDGPWVLRGVNLVIRAGVATGLVGVNGAGKSTLVKLLARFYDVDHGAILWDGIDIRELDPVALRRRLAATFQDFMTYELSAGENVGIAQADALDDQPRIRNAASLAGIDDALAELPSGYDTLLSSELVAEPCKQVARVASLSGGQWQRIALARAVIRHDADVVVLDEPSSGLDAEAEARIHAMLDLRFAGRTRILISHRLNAMRGAALIAVLADGAIVERGTHDELMAKRGSYAKWFSTQATGYQDARVVAGAA